MIEKSPAMNKCEKELAKKENLLISKDNYNSSINCIHPFVKGNSSILSNIDIEFNLYPTIPKYSINNIKEELVEDIKLTEEKVFIKKYYLY